MGRDVTRVDHISEEGTISGNRIKTRYEVHKVRRKKFTMINCDNLKKFSEILFLHYFRIFYRIW